MLWRFHRRLIFFKCSNEKVVIKHFFDCKIDLSTMERLETDVQENENETISPCRTVSIGTTTATNNVNGEIAPPRMPNSSHLQQASLDSTIKVATSRWENLLHIVTELILIISGIIVFVSCGLSLGVAVLGIARIQKGLDYYTKHYHEKWENYTNFL